MADTYTFDNTLAEDKDWVRFHVGDTDVEAAYLTDELITALLTKYAAETDPVKKATIAAIKYIITQLASPRVKFDWMIMDPENARRGMVELLAAKEAEFGVYEVTLTTVVNHPYRADSNKTDGVYA